MSEAPRPWTRPPSRRAGKSPSCSGTVSRWPARSTAGRSPPTRPATTALPMRSPPVSRCTYAAISLSLPSGLRIEHNSSVLSANASIIAALFQRQKRTTEARRRAFGSKTSVASVPPWCAVAVALGRSNGNSEVAERRIERRLLVGALLARADDQRAGREVIPGREFARAHSGNDDASRGDAPLDLLLALARHAAAARTPPPR